MKFMQLISETDVNRKPLYLYRDQQEGFEGSEKAVFAPTNVRPLCFTENLDTLR